MRLRAAIPRFLASTVEAGPEREGPVLDGRDVIVPNLWKLPPHTVALAGRPAVWVAFDVATPQIPLGIVTIPALRLRWEQDFGGHLYLIAVDGDASHARIVEGGPLHPNGSGALVPFHYPEDDFVRRNVVDFDPIPIPVPHGLDASAFVDLVLSTHRAYDGNQRYLAVELPFLRVGRDSNSYAVGVLLACGVDTRDVPKPAKTERNEWTGYPGAEDPVHRSNFGAFLGAMHALGDGTVVAQYHDADGSPRLIALGGRPNGTATLPDGAGVTLDRLGRRVLLPADAAAAGLPVQRAEPPRHIAARRRFPSDPDPGGALITLLVNERAEPLEPSREYEGNVVARHDPLALAELQTGDARVVLPLIELGVELRDPKRVDRLVRVGNGLVVGLHRDRHPKLIARGEAAAGDLLHARALHASLPHLDDVARNDVVRDALAGAGAGLTAAAVLGGVLAAVRRNGSPAATATEAAAGVAGLAALGAAAGAGYGALTGRFPQAGFARGAPFGLALWGAARALAGGAAAGPAGLAEGGAAALWAVSLDAVLAARRRRRGATSGPGGAPPTA